MKLATIILILFAFCNRSNAQKKIYNESNYFLVRVDSTSEGLHNKLYVYKYDTARKMGINFYYNGARLGKGFYYHNKLDGPLIVYSDEGKIIATATYSNGKMTSSKQYDKPTNPLKIFKNGKVRTATNADIDSFLKK